MPLAPKAPNQGQSTLSRALAAMAGKMFTLMASYRLSASGCRDS